jgi:uncharacterized membrane protein
MFGALKASDDMEGNSMTRRISIVFSAGALGGLLNALLFWLFGMVGITALVGMHAPIKWDPQHIYWGVTWGGIWGAMFLLPWLKGSVLLRGLLFSMVSSISLARYGTPGAQRERTDAFSDYRAQRCLGNRRGAMGS